jgi:hypothetical protein
MSSAGIRTNSARISATAHCFYSSLPTVDDLIERKSHVRLPRSHFLYALMVVLDGPSHRSAQLHSSRAQQMEAVNTHRPHSWAMMLVKVRMVMRIVGIHDALLTADSNL